MKKKPCIYPEMTFVVKVGMRNFHVHPNNSNLYQPGVNLDKLWSLVSEQVLFQKSNCIYHMLFIQTRLKYAGVKGKAPVIDVSRAVAYVVSEII